MELLTTNLLKKSSGALENYRGFLGADANLLRPLKGEEVKLLTVLMTIPGEAMNLMKQIMNESSVRLMLGWLNDTGMTVYVTPGIVAFLGSIANRPAEILMWTYTLAQMVIEEEATPESPIDLETFVEGKYFGHGLPSENLIKKRWNEQQLLVVAAGQKPLDHIEDIKLWPHVQTPESVMAALAAATANVVDTVEVERIEAPKADENGCCPICKEPMKHNIPRMGDAGGFVHTKTGSFKCSIDKQPPVV